MKYADLPQGSFLSPLLFLFFNADLVKSVINKNRGVITFVDDHTTWVIGDLVKPNIAKL